MKRKLSFCLLFPAVLLLLGNCGLYDYAFLYPVSNITMSTNLKSTVILPSSNNDAFTHYTIYYRIYASEANITWNISITNDNNTADMASINTQLRTDLQAIRGYIDSDKMVTKSMYDLFVKERNYYELALWDIVGGAPCKMEKTLDDNLKSHTLEFDFYGVNPTMIVKNPSGGIAGSYILQRSSDISDPQPDRYFSNDSKLYDPAESYYKDKITKNPDVVPKSTVTRTDADTYAAMFIVAVGTNPADYTDIYSTPALINIFRLP